MPATCLSQRKLGSTLRPGAVKRQEGPTRFEDGEKGNDEFNGALQANPNDHLSANAQIPEVMGQLVGAGVEFAVGDLLIPEHQRNRLRRALHLLLKQLMHAQLRHLNNRPLLP